MAKSFNDEYTTGRSLMAPVIYERSAAQPIPSGTVTIYNYNIKVTDDDNTVTTGSNWKFTAPHDGVYRINASSAWLYNVTWTVKDRYNIIIRQYNSSNVLLESRYNRNVIELNTVAGDIITRSFQINTMFDMSSGDYLQVQLWQNTGSGRNTFNSTHYQVVCITEEES